MGLINTLFGGSNSKNGSESQSTSSSLSRNLAFPFLQGEFGGLTGAATDGTEAIMALLGLGGNPQAQEDAFSRFRNSTGYDFLQNEGARGINAEMGARGLRTSGAALRALDDRRTQIANTTFGDYLKNLFGLSDTGFKAGQLISGAGGQSESQSQATSRSWGKASSGKGLLGGLASLGPSGSGG